MNERWRAVGVLAGALFAVNVVARLVIEFGFEGEAGTAADRVSLGMFLVIGLILAVLAFRRGHREPLARWGTDIGAAVLVALLATVLVGPLLVGNNPFAGGFGAFLAQIGFYLVAAGAGILVGYLLLTALGRDHRSRQLARYARDRTDRPRRVVGR
jgi:hypothetical protein